MSLFRPATDRQINIGLTILRAVVGVIFLVHGSQKLFVFGFAGVTGAFAQMGVPAPGLLGPFVAFVEFFGGMALITGLLTRLASLGLMSTMIVAISLVHLKGGFFSPTGVELPLSLLGSTLLLAVTGAGAWSLDGVIGRRGTTVRKDTKAVRLSRAA
ncbi:MAG TPA: DoxX family protein [Gemmatimonadaceae bacterium]